MSFARIYVASSWRNPYQATVVGALRHAGHEVYDFKNPKPGDRGFSWKQVGHEEDFVDPNQGWSAERLRAALLHPVAQEGFANDVGAMEWASEFCLVMPAGRSAHLEAGWAMGRGKPCSVFVPDPVEPELMYLLDRVDARCICSTVDDPCLSGCHPRRT